MNLDTTNQTHVVMGSGIGSGFGAPTGVRPVEPAAQYINNIPTPQPQHNNHSVQRPNLPPQYDGYATSPQASSEIYLKDPEPIVIGGKITPITGRVDDESLKILMDTNELFRETVINMGIKLVATTEVYKTYFKIKTEEEIKEKTESVNSSPSTNLLNNVDSIIGGGNSTASNVKPATATAPKSGGFSSWG